MGKAISEDIFRIACAAGKTALHYLASNDSEEAANYVDRFIQRAGREILAHKDVRGRTALMVAQGRNADWPVAKKLNTWTSQVTGAGKNGGKADCSDYVQMENLYHAPARPSMRLELSNGQSFTGPQGMQQFDKAI